MLLHRLASAVPRSYANGRGSAHRAASGPPERSAGRSARPRRRDVHRPVEPVLRARSTEADQLATPRSRPTGRRGCGVAAPSCVPERQIASRSAATPCGPASRCDDLLLELSRPRRAARASSSRPAGADSEASSSASTSVRAARRTRRTSACSTSRRPTSARSCSTRTRSSSAAGTRRTCSRSGAARRRPVPASRPGGRVVLAGVSAGSICWFEAGGDRLVPGGARRARLASASCAARSARTTTARRRGVRRSTGSSAAGFPRASRRTTRSASGQRHRARRGRHIAADATAYRVELVDGEVARSRSTAQPPDGARGVRCLTPDTAGVRHCDDVPASRATVRRLPGRARRPARARGRRRALRARARAPRRPPDASTRARSSPCSAPTARARRRRCARSPAPSAARAPSAWPGARCRGARRRWRGPGSRTSPRAAGRSAS